mgnify:CR=1 FL=1
MKTIRNEVSVQADARGGVRFSVAKKLAVLAVAASLSSVAVAAPETYVIDGKHALPRFEYSHFGYSTQSSRFDTTQGTIVYDAAAKTGSVGEPRMIREPSASVYSWGSFRLA